MAELFKLPSSSYDELIKLIQAYASEKEGVALSLDDISHATGIARTVVSANNGFFVQIGLIAEGNKKAATENGRSLGRAYSLKIEHEVERIWRSIIQDNDFLSRMISAVRIRNGMDRGSFLGHIVYSSGQKDNRQNRTGAGAIIEIFKTAGLLSETDGKLTINEINEELELDRAASENEVNSPNTTQVRSLRNAVQSNTGIMINININCAPSDLAELGTKIKSLIKSVSEE